MTDGERVERLLRSALVPVEPPVTLADRVEHRLSELTEAAAGELADWELSAMGDPRNWFRPIAAVVVGGAAGGALVLVRARRRKRGIAAARAVQRSMRGLASGVERRIRR